MANWAGGVLLLHALKVSNHTVQVVNEQATPITNAMVYRNGQLLTATNSLGQLTYIGADGDKFVALEDEYLLHQTNNNGFLNEMVAACTYRE